MTTFLGYNVDNLTFSNDIEYKPYEHLEHNNDEVRRQLLCSVPQYRLAFDLRLVAREEFDRLRRITSEPFALTSLGRSTICRHCGFVIKPGSILCHRCGSCEQMHVANSRFHTICIAQLRDASFESMNHLYDLYHSWTYSYIAHVHFKITGSINRFYDDTGITSAPDFNWQTIHAANTWLCRYCNSVNDWRNSECCRCGSGQLPFRDILALSHQCLYCGMQLKNEFVCKQCGNAANGYAMWLPYIRIQGEKV